MADYCPETATARCVDLLQQPHPYVEDVGRDLVAAVETAKDKTVFRQAAFGWAEIVYRRSGAWSH